MQNRAVQRLQQYREARAFDIEQLAADLRVPRPTLTGWLYNGKVPRRKKMTEMDRRGIVTAADWFAAADSVAA